MVETTTSILKQDGMVRKGGIQVKKKNISFLISSFPPSSSHVCCRLRHLTLITGDFVAFVCRPTIVL